MSKRLLSLAFLAFLALPVAAFAACEPDDEICAFPTDGGEPSTGTVSFTVKVVNDNGGILLPSNTLVKLVDSLQAPVTTFAGSDVAISFPTLPGTYSIMGGDHAGYVKTYSPGCSFTLTPDQSTSCVITYEDEGTAAPVDACSVPYAPGCPNPMNPQPTTPPTTTPPGSGTGSGTGGGVIDPVSGNLPRTGMGAGLMAALLGAAGLAAAAKRFR